MSTQRECQVIMLPSEDSSHIVINNYLNVRHGKKAIQYLTELIPTVEQAEDRGFTPQHLYVVSDDELIVGDWYIHTWLGEVDVQQFTTSQIKDREEHSHHYRICCKKIIATTDKSLSSVRATNCGNLNCNSGVLSYTNGKNEICKKCNPDYQSLPSLSTGFIKKYCELRGIDKIIVDYKMKYKQGDIGLDFDTIPVVRPDNTIITHPVKTEWSREEVEVLCRKAYEAGQGQIPNQDDWIKQNL